jgi:nucleoside-diphosphate-sugar epimerase
MARKARNLRTPEEKWQIVLEGLRSGKIAETLDGSEIELWGNGKQTRSFLIVDECVEGIRRLVESDFSGPVNIGSEEMVTINQLAEIIMDVAGKRVRIKHVSGPLGVRGRNSDNHLIREKVGWEPKLPLRAGLANTYEWIA